MTYTGGFGLNVYSNTLDSFVSTLGIIGINQDVIANTMSYYKNKLYNFVATSASSTINAINIKGGVAPIGSGYTDIKIYNNLIAQLYAPAGTLANNIAPYNVINGINLVGGTATAVRSIVSNNTIYLNATSSGATFGSAGILHAGSANATYNNLLLRNNVIVNNSTPNGTAGFAVAIRRAGYTANLTNNFDSASDNNLLYGTSGMYTDSLHTYTNATAYHNAFPSQGLHSIAANVTFLSTSGSNANFLRPDPSVATPVESGGIAITGITDDYAGNVRNVVTPDLGAYEGTYISADTISPIITFTPLVSAVSSLANLSVPSFATIYDQHGVNTTAGTKPRIYYKKTSDNNAFGANTSAANGWKYSEATNTTSPFSFTIDYSLLQAPAAINDTIQYFVVAQDMATVPNAGPNNAILLSTNPTSVNLTAPNTVAGTINYYRIVPALAGTVTVGTGAGQNYNSLSSAGGLFEAINNGVVSNNITAIVNSNTIETGVDTLKNWVEEGTGNYKINIVSDGTVERRLMGSNAAMITLSGVKNVTFDGGSNKYLRFTNTNISSTGSTFNIVNDCKSDTIKNCYIEGATSGAGTAASANIILGGSNVANGNGNDSIVIINNIIKDTLGTVLATVTPGCLIKSNANNASLLSNDAIIISGNQFVNWNADAISIGGAALGGNNWKIMNNSFYQTIPKTTSLFGVRLYSTNAGYGDSIVGNSFGGSAADRSGSAMTTSFSGATTMISVAQNISATIPTVVLNNTISNITVSGVGSTVFTGITISSGSGMGIISGNKVANIKLTGNAGTTIFYGIVGSGYATTISDNIIGGAGTDRIALSGAIGYGIFNNSSAITRIQTVRNNTIRNIVSTYANASTTAANSVAGIYAAGGAFIYDHNTVDSIVGNNTGDLSVTSPAGIEIGNGLGTAANSVSNNTISNIVNTNTTATATAVGVVGIQVATSSSSAMTKVFGNTITNVYGLNTTATAGAGNNVVGIHAFGSAVSEADTFYNNVVALGANTTPQTWMRGIAVSGVNPSGFTFYNNTVVLIPLPNLK